MFISLGSPLNVTFKVIFFHCASKCSFSVPSHFCNDTAGRRFIRKHLCGCTQDKGSSPCTCETMSSASSGQGTFKVLATSYSNLIMRSSDSQNMAFF